MKTRTGTILVLLLCMRSVMFADSARSSNKMILFSPQERASFENGLRMLCGKLWTNDFSKCEMSIHKEPSYVLPVTHDGIAEFRLDGIYYIMSFSDSNLDKATYISGTIQEMLTRLRRGKPIIHMDYDDVEKKITDYATLFGVSNLWDKARFESSGEIRPGPGYWAFDAWVTTNGYRTPFHLSIAVADLPDLPLVHWSFDPYKFPSRFPTNVLLTSEQASAKALEHAEKYCKNFFGDIALFHGGTVLNRKDTVKIVVLGSRLEYVIPNYNYIRPADGMGGLSNYVPKKDDIALAWNCQLGTPQGAKHKVKLRIYVDAATGEMLGGTD